ncbi:MAG: type I glyceraldehyde-3-phosphate dehydrogenase [Halobacteria archaeon]
MGKVRVGVNGFGRIGRNFLRASLGRNLEFVAVNDLTDAKTLAHLLKWDSVHGPLGKPVQATGRGFTVDGQEVRVLAEKEPAKLPWGELGVDVVVESTGRFTDREPAALHLKGGAKKVVISAPSKNADATLVMGVNEKAYDPAKHSVVSNASCTTNCLAPVAHVLHSKFKIQRGFMTTVHSYTNDQSILDLQHKDLRRARAAAVSIIPSTTGAASALHLVLPDLKGKMDGIALRVPTPNVSMIDLNAVLEKPATKEEVNAALKEAARGPLKGILDYTDEPLVSVDFNDNPHSAIVDGPSTNAIGNLAKVFAWYDNEWGYSNRLVDLVEFIGKKL